MVKTQFLSHEVGWYQLWGNRRLTRQILALGIRSSRDQVSLRASLRVELTGKPGCRDSLADVDRVKAPGSRAAGTGQPPASALIVLWMEPIDMHGDVRVTRPGEWTEVRLRTRPFCPPDPSARRHDAIDEDIRHGCHVVQDRQEVPRV